MGADNQEDLVQVTRHDGWAEVALNRPERRNALTGPLLLELTRQLRNLSTDDEIAAVVLFGNGGAFTSGHDLKVLQAEPPPPWAASLAAIARETHLALFDFPRPIIGALELCAINAGAALALSCDVLIAGETAFLQVGEIQQGAPIAMNAAWLRLKVGEAAAARVVLYGDRVKATELHRLGIVAEVVADSEVLVRARAIAERMAGFPKGSPTRIKADIRAQSRISDPNAWFREQNTSVLFSAGTVG